MNKKVKNFLKTMVLLAASLVVCFVILEYVVARFYYSDVQYIRDKEFHETLGWQMKLGTYVVKAPQAIRKHEVRVNRFGLRGGDVPLVSDSERRVIVLGDSFIFGKASREDDLATTRLAAHLNKAGMAAYDVLNAAVPGYGTAQQLLAMKALSDKGVTGDIYVMVMFVNDILDNLRMNYRDRSINPRAPGFVLNDEGQLTLAQKPRRLVRSSNGSEEATETFVAVQEPRRKPKSLIFLGLRIEAFMQSRPSLIRFAEEIGIHVEFPFKPSLINGWYVDEVLEQGVPLTIAILREAKREASRNGGRLLVALIPSSIQVYRESYGPILKRTFHDDPAVDVFLADPGRPQKIIADLCDELGVPFLDLLPIMQQNNARELYTPREGHFSREGHGLAAEALSVHILKHASQ